MTPHDDANDAPAFDTSAIPDDASYWDGLARRVTDGATHSESGLEWLSGSRAGLAVGLLAASAIITLAILSNATAPTSPSRESVVTFAASDDVARAVMFRNEPPSVGALVLASTTRGAR